jgi:hypothetical protein
MRTKTVFTSLMIAMMTLFLTVPNQTFAQEDEEGFTFGGAVRYNFISESYESDPTATNTYFTWDTWRLNVDGSVADVDLSFEYRFYPTFGSHFIHHGFLGYAFSDNLYMELGVTQVPFGITTYASHSWWFQGPYYVGLEDDYDMGINFDYTPSDKLKLSFSYFRQAEPEGPISWGNGGVTFGNAGAGRYSYDITSYQYTSLAGNPVSIRELNQFNVRAAYNLDDSWEIGASAQIGGIYNTTLQESETSTAFAGHVVGNFGGGFNLKAEYIKYNYNAKDDAGEDLELIQMGAYGVNNMVASEASLYVAGLAYSIPVEWGPISNIQPYVDYTLVDKANENFENMHHLIPGFLVTAGSIYTYVDFAMGKNQPWLTEDFGTGLGTGRTWSNDPADQGKFFYTNDASKVGQPVPTDEVDWNLRFNINIGYYF